MDFAKYMHLERLLPFSVWLEKQHPAHSEYDFDNKWLYEEWKSDLFKAYCAGAEFERVARDAGM